MLSQSHPTVLGFRRRPVAVRRDPRSRILFGFLAVLVSLGVLVEAPPCGAREGPGRVLVIESERADLPLWVEFGSAFSSALEAGCESPIDIYVEHLDVARLGGADYLDRAAAWLTEKYRGVRPDVIVTVGPETYRLMQRWPGLFPADTSLVSVAIDESTFNDVGRLPHSTCLLRDFGQTETVRLALELFPETRHLAIVAGPADPQSYSRLFRSQLVETFAERLDIIDLSGLSLAEIRARATRLPEDTVLILTAMAVDGDGREVTHPEVVAAIAPVANAPMFGSIRTELGHGLVGGHLFDPRISGRQTAALVARILNGEPADSIEPTLSDVSVVAFDWRELRRWGISPDRLPPGSVIEFRPPTLWEEHRGAVLLTVGVVGLQSVLIVALLRSRHRRKKINRELHRLSGRLITAQEDERRRVARELHDDISQRLALLAIELESPDAGRHLAATASDVQHLARDVHVLAHNLQPPRLQGSGLASELREFCETVDARREARIDCRLPDVEFELPEEAALALYRIAQEAVQNAVKHSGGDEVAVELTVSPRWASITVADDGCGMDQTVIDSERGLGLASMRERIRSVDGWLTIGVGPQGGTAVSAWAPVESRPRGEETDASTAPVDR